MWLQKLKKKKLQCFLIGMFIFLSTLIFTSSLSLITSITDYVNKYYANEKYYDLILYNTNEVATNRALNWCKNNSKIKEVKNIDAFCSGNNLYKSNENLKVENYEIVPLESMQKPYFGITKVKQLNNNECPKTGEIWVSQIFADSYNVSLGNTLKFKMNSKTISLKVTAVINDSLHPTSMIGTVFLYTNKNSTNDFSSFEKEGIMFVELKKGENVKDIEKSLSSAIGSDSFEIDKAELIQWSTSIISMIGGSATLASLLVFVVSVFLIRFIMWNNILKEYKSIGIYKALGFSNKEILKFYIVGYSLIAVIGSTLGVLCSIPIQNYTASKVLKYIGNFNGISVNYNVIMFTVLSFSLIVILNLYFVIRRTYKISPVKAFVTGVTSSRKKLTKSIVKNNCSSLALAINDIFKYKKISTYIAGSLTLALTLVILFGNLNFTISKMSQNLNVWFGIPKASITISSLANNSSEDMKKALSYVKKDKRVKNYVYGSIETSDVALDTQKYKIKNSICSVSTMNSYSDDLGFTIVKGHNPKNENEVAVSLNVLSDTGLSIGDYIELSIKNKKSTYLIAGSYNSEWENGYCIRMLNSQIEKYSPNFSYNEIFVNLKNDNNIQSFERDINRNFTYIDASNIEPLMKYVTNSTPSIVMPITYLLIVVFVLFSSVTILNIIAMIIRDSRRNFGIMKALGFTYREIRNRYLYRILILTVVSILLSIMLNMMFARSIVAAVIDKMDVLIISPITIAGLIALMLVLILSITFICCQSIKKAKPTELMEE